MAEIVMNEPNPKQRLMFMSRARRVGYGGARGGGKSWAVRHKAIRAIMTDLITTLTIILLHRDISAMTKVIRCTRVLFLPMILKIKIHGRTLRISLQVH